MQSSARKAVERVFGVLFARFGILYQPCRLQDLKDMQNVMKACCIMHNMMALERSYYGTSRFRMEGELSDDEVT